MCRTQQLHGVDFGNKSIYVWASKMVWVHQIRCKLPVGVGFVLYSCLRLYLKTIATKLAAGPPGRPAKLVWSPAHCRPPWQAGQIQTRKGIINYLKPASK